MKEQDIKKLFNAASEGRESDVNSEEIKKAVLGKLGKNSLSNSNAEGEAVEPIFVNPQKKKNKFTALKIVAGTAAACLGVVVIGNIVNLNNDGFSTLSDGDSGTEVNLTEETTAEGTLTEESNESTEATAANPSDTPPNGLSSTGTNLWDKTLVNYNYKAEVVTFDFKDSFNIISEKDGRMYLMESLWMLPDENGEKASDVDLTDYLNSNPSYCMTVVNEDRSQLLQFIVVGGSVSDNDYGYVIMHKIPYIDKWVQVAKFSAKTTEMIGKSASDREMPQWYLDTLEQIKEQFPNQEIIVAEDGCYKEYVDFKGEEPAQTVDNTPNMSAYAYAEPLMENPDLEFCLLSRSLIQYNKKTDTCSNIASMNPQYPLSYKGSRLFYTGNGKNTDITDLISDEDYFWTSYVNPVTGLDHHIIVGGSIEENDYGYIELFKMYEDDNQWHVEYISTKDHSEGWACKNESEWINRTMDKVMQTLREGSHPGEFIYYSGSGRVADFSK